jgi:NAD(P)-dependent dehydrogenase (short-subunit alcohol dehydrogenase family)
VGGSSGIGLELVRILIGDRHEIYVGSRTADTLAEIPGVHHIPMDVAVEKLDMEQLPETLQGLVYCPGTIVLKPFQRLTIDDFKADFNVNLLGAVKVIQGCIKQLKNPRRVPP